MNINRLLLSAVVLAVLGLVVWRVSPKKPEQAPDSQSATQSPVTVEVVPVALAKDSPRWEFRVALNTHSLELNEDMAEATVMVGNGREYPPLGWEGDGPGGHHREGILRFKSSENQLVQIISRKPLGKFRGLEDGKSINNQQKGIRHV
jgi:hypothetical protein